MFRDTPTVFTGMLSVRIHYSPVLSLGLVIRLFYMYEAPYSVRIALFFTEKDTLAARSTHNGQINPVEKAMSPSARTCPSDAPRIQVSVVVVYSNEVTLSDCRAFFAALDKFLSGQGCKGELVLVAGRCLPPIRKQPCGLAVAKIVYLCHRGTLKPLKP